MLRLRIVLLPFGGLAVFLVGGHAAGEGTSVARWCGWGGRRPIVLDSGCSRRASASRLNFPGVSRVFPLPPQPSSHGRGRLGCVRSSLGPGGPGSTAAVTLRRTRFSRAPTLLRTVLRQIAQWLLFPPSARHRGDVSSHVCCGSLAELTGASPTEGGPSMAGSPRVPILSHPWVPREWAARQFRSSSLGPGSRGGF